MNYRPDTFGSPIKNRVHIVATLLLAAVFVFGQSVAQQHVHVDGELTASCVVCHHSDNTTGLAPSSVAVITVAPEKSVCTPSFEALSLTQPSYDHQSRAPPVAG